MATCPQCGSYWDPENELICLSCGLQMRTTTRPYYVGVPASQLPSVEEPEDPNFDKKLSKPLVTYPSFWRASEADDEDAQIRRSSLLVYAIPETGVLGELISKLKDYALKLFKPTQMLDEQDLKARRYFNLARLRIGKSYYIASDYLKSNGRDADEVAIQQEWGKDPSFGAIGITSDKLNEGLKLYHFYNFILFGDSQTQARSALLAPESYFDTMSFEFLGVACAIVEVNR